MRLIWWRFWFLVWFFTRGYYLLAKIYRALFERKYKGPLTTFTTLAGLEAVLSQMRWVQDPLGGRLDLISKPEKVEHIWREYTKKGRPAPETSLDCDEFAIYSAHAVKGLPNVATVYYLSTVWFDRDDGRFRGHNVCAFYDSFSKQWAHISNWDRGKTRHGFERLSYVIENIVDGGQLIGWAAATPELRSIDYSIRLPQN